MPSLSDPQHMADVTFRLCFEEPSTTCWPELCIELSTYICTYIHVHIYMYIYTSTHINIHESRYTYIHKCTHIYINMCTYINIQKKHIIFRYTYIYICYNTEAASNGCCCFTFFRPNTPPCTRETFHPSFPLIQTWPPLTPAVSPDALELAEAEAEAVVATAPEDAAEAPFDPPSFLL